MSGTSAPCSPRIQRRLAELAQKPLNFDLASLAGASPRSGWTITELCQSLPAEPPGMPVEQGSWEIARRLMSGYEFADPSIVRAYYDPAVPLEQRDMLLKLQAFGVAHVFVGVRVGEVFERTRELGGRSVLTWGWNYRTLEGHVEMGQMDWEVWKWIDTGQVRFHVYAVSRPAPIPNPLVAIGFRLLRSHERGVFLASTERRMVTFTRLGLGGDGREDRVRAASGELTARSLPSDDAAHDQLARQLETSD